MFRLVISVFIYIPVLSYFRFFVPLCHFLFLLSRLSFSVFLSSFAIFRFFFVPFCKFRFYCPVSSFSVFCVPFCHFEFFFLSRFVVSRFATCIPGIYTCVGVFLFVFYFVLCLPFFFSNFLGRSVFSVPFVVVGVAWQKWWGRERRSVLAPNNLEREECSRWPFPMITLPNVHGNPPFSATP